MADENNTGRVIISTLWLIDTVTGQRVPNVAEKPNVDTDPDYITSPYTDTVQCPIVYSTDCPVVIATPVQGGIEYEFSLPNAVVTNLSVLNLVIVQAVDGSTVAASMTWGLPNVPPNYFHGTLTGLTRGKPYELRVVYYLNGALVKTCGGNTYSPT